MKKGLIVSLLFSVVMLAPSSSLACGDKLLHLTRIYRNHPKGRPKAVVIYARPNSLLESAAALRLERAFRDEGYDLLLIDSERELARALQAGVADVVIADVRDTQSLSEMKSAAPFLVIPVATAGNDFEKIESSHYAAVIKWPGKAGKFLDAVDRALNSKLARQNLKLHPTNNIIR